ncbi:MAG: sporulation integral membrane protein YtvI [Clostridia bacterium]|nr:sporulation integral membrane protein YtvI [Clostridia bacterium]
MNDKWLKAENIAKKIVILAILSGGAILLFLFIPKLLSLLFPFVAAYVISLIASPLTRLFEKLKLPGALSAIISILFVAAALFGISALLIDKIITELYDFSMHIPEIYNSVRETLSELKIVAIDIFNLLPGDFTAINFTDLLENLSVSLSGLSSTIVETISSATINFVRHIPGILIAFVFSILASYFLIRDRRKVKRSLSSILGTGLSARLSEVKLYLSEAVFAYIKAQSILMSITFVEVFIGLSILNVRYSFLFAIMIALIDAIPVFGTGTIVIPWALYHLITGNFPMAIGLLVIYAVCLVVRQFLEPKILSSQIGVHPLVTLLAMYVGYRLIGIFGMILGPVTALVTKNILTKYAEHTKTSG